MEVARGKKTEQGKNEGGQVKTRGKVSLPSSSIIMLFCAIYGTAYLWPSLHALFRLKARFVIANALPN